MADPAPYPIRSLTPDEWDAAVTLNRQAFGAEPRPGDVELDRTLFECDRAFGAYDGDDANSVMVGLTTAYSLTMTVPGGPRPVAGVTWVSVLPTYRRRGVLTSLMRRQLHDLHDAGREPVAALWASELAIYGRFGYGAASRHTGLRVPRHAAQLAAAPVDDGLRLRLVPAAESLAMCDEVYAEQAARRPGMIMRTTEAWRRAAIYDPEHDREGAGTLRVVIAEDPAAGDGALGVRGYARYATVSRWESSGPEGEVRVRELIGRDPAATAALWRYLFGVDLMTTTVTPSLPLDDPLLTWLAESRRAQPVLRDGLFVRLVDVGRALADRTYTTPVDVTLEVVDRLCPWNHRRWRLTGDSTGATCEPTGAPPDLVLDVRELGSAYLGGPSLGALAEAGLVEVRDRDALRIASAAFRAEREPWCPFIF